MAARGAKPKSAHLRLLDGTHRTTRHGDAVEVKKAVETSAASFGKIEKPAGLSGEGLAAWDRYITPAVWLDASKEPLAIAFCDLWAEFRADPLAFNSSRHGQLRHYMAELGLSDERNRVEKAGEVRDEFFDD